MRCKSIGFSTEISKMDGTAFHDRTDKLPVLSTMCRVVKVLISLPTFLDSAVTNPRIPATHTMEFSDNVCTSPRDTGANEARPSHQMARSVLGIRQTFDRRFLSHRESFLGIVLRQHQFLSMHDGSDTIRAELGHVGIPNR